jgi:osmoprotectant transport system ATP-binding protein
MRRLHREVAKTIIFVTHDIDEAITMGDRIAILRQGGMLAQYDTPDAILAHPADEFVERFIGEDRALRRLALRRVGDVQLGPVRSQTLDVGNPGTATVAVTATVRNAVSLLLETGKRELLVVGDDGAPAGVLTFEQATALLRS